LLLEKMTTRIFGAVDATLLGIFNLFRFLARFLPPSLLVAIANLIGYALYYARREARESLLPTLHEALPEVTEERARRQIARKAFGAPFRTMLDFILLERHGDRIMARLTLDEGLIEAFDRARVKGTGAIVLAPHMGAIGINHCLFARVGRAYTAVAMPPHDTPIPRYLGALVELASQLGCDPECPVFWTGIDTVNKVHEHLGKGGIVGITFDMAGGTVMDFFGQPAAIASGIAHFAYDCNAPIISGYFRRGRGPLDYEMRGFPELSYSLTGERSADVKMILDQVIRIGEEMIRDAPEQWIGWFGLRSWRKKARQILDEKANAPQ
jgi:lauroyl/myristoyl acyltransferase